MRCPRCGKPMREFRRTYHKQRKWKCRVCGRVRFQRSKNRKAKETN